MTDVEAAIFWPAVQQARADIGLSLNSKPSEQWYSDMYQMHGTSAAALGELEHWQSGLPGEQVEPLCAPIVCVVHNESHLPSGIARGRHAHVPVERHTECTR